MNRFPRPAAAAPPVNPPPAPPAPAPVPPSPSAARRSVAPPRPSGLRSPVPGVRLREPGLKDVAAGWVAKHPAVGLGAAAAVGAAVGWLLKRR